MGFEKMGPQRSSKMGARESILREADRQMVQNTSPGPSPHPVHPEAGTTEQSIGKTQKETRFPVALALGMTFFTAAAGATGIYCWEKKIGPFAEKTQTSDQQESDNNKGYTSPPPKSQKLPEEIGSPEDLQAYIDVLNLHPSADDFEQVPPNPQAQALFLKKEGENYTWNGMNQKITEIPNDSTIIAVKVNNEAPGIKITYEGLQPIMTYRDDPTNTSFVAYDCHSQPAKGRPILGQINVSYHGKPQWFRSINIGRCSEEQPMPE